MKSLNILLVVILSITGVTIKAQKSSPKSTKGDYIVGAIPGDFGVSPSGAATYTIPIDLPAGIAGMTPHITLTYNSQGGNGILGMGWAMSGLSGISRTGTTLYNDGYIEGVDFDANDKFKLDGKRLLEVGFFEYRTENETYSKIIRYGSVLEGPDWFEVHTKDGKIIEYGHTPDSKIEASGRDDVLFWLVNRISDRKGNYIDFIYHEANGNAEISKIKYTGNNTLQINPFYEIDFEYDDRYDINKFYISGSVITKNDVLDQIRVKYKDGTVLRKYNFFYDENGIYSRLKKVEMSGENGTNLPATNFEWGAKTPDFIEKNTNLDNGEYKADYTLGDFNGDGRTDIVRAYYQTEVNEQGDEIKVFDHCTVSYADTDGETFTEENFDFFQSESFDYFIAGDFNGDGIDDLMRINRKYINGIIELTPELYIKTQSGFASSNTYFAPIYFDENGGGYFLQCDMNGNGISELLTVRAQYSVDLEKYTTWLDAKEFNPNTNAVTDLFINPPNETGYSWEHNEEDLQPVSIGDFNGDGKSDLLVNKTAGSSTIFLFDDINNKLIDLASPDFPTKDQFVKVGDFNGDGVSDILTFEKNFNGEKINFKLHYFNGKGLWIQGSCPIVESNDSRIWFNNKHFILKDYNGDGKTDILQVHDVYERQEGDSLEPGWWDYITTSFYVHYSTGMGFNTESINISNNYEPYDSKMFYPGSDFNGDRKDECLLFKNNSHHILTFHPNEKSNMINKATNGFGVQTAIIYKPLTNPDVYTKGTGATYPIVDIQAPLYVVDTLLPDSDFGTNIETVYHYAGAKIHKRGKGFLGFAQMTVTNNMNKTITTTNYNIFTKDIEGKTMYYYPYAKKSTVKTFGDKLLSSTESVLDVKSNQTNNYIFTPVDTASLSKSWDTDNSFVKTVKTVQNINDIDQYGNSVYSEVLTDPEKLNLDTPDHQFDFKIEKATTYIYDAGNWLISRPETITVKKYDKDDSNSDDLYTKYTYYNYNEAQPDGVEPWPSVKSIEKSPDYTWTNELGIKTTYEYDEFGHITKKTLSAPNANPPLNDRVTWYAFDQQTPGYDGRFLTQTKKIIGNSKYKSNYTYYIKTGKLLTETDPARLTTTYLYNSFGTPTEVDYPDGTVKTMQYDWNSGNNYGIPPEALYWYSEHKEGEPSTQINYYDKFGRNLINITFGLNPADMIYTKNVYYANNGRLEKTSEPYFYTGNPTQWTTLEYDDLGRVIQKNTPSNSFTYGYSGRTTTTTNSGTGVTVTKTSNAIGKPVTITDPAGTISYSYFSSGNVKTIDALGAVTTMEYDDAGNQKLLNDPNAGTTSYKYNAFGELTKQTDANGNIYEMEYDLFGRLINKTLINTGEETVYNYNNVPNLEFPGMGFGLLNNITGPNGITYFYNYDRYNRQIRQTEVIDGQNYTEHYQYNNLGQLETVTYPSGFAIKYHYNNNGFLSKVENNTTQQTLWEATTMNARGQLTEYRLGNGLVTKNQFDVYGFPSKIQTGHAVNKYTDVQNLGYTFDAHTGNLLSRTDNKYNLTENFGYDGPLHNNLTSWHVTGYYSFYSDYALNGNITNKSDVTGWEPPGSYQYGNKAGLNAVTGIQYPTTQYSDKAQPQNITYTPFNKVSYIGQIKKNGNLEDTYGVNITYGPDHARKKALYIKNKGILKTKYYIGANYEIEQDAKGDKRKIHYISGGNGLFAIYVQNQGQDTMYYVQKDYLGSYYSITDENGNIVLLHDREEQVFSFDPWGRRRNPQDWTYNNVPTSHLFDRGFTGHEHLNNFDLINMNGRMYDPWLGRFLSPDPFVQAPTYSQNFNRYSYAFNNPLKFTDPSGYYTRNIATGFNWNWSRLLGPGNDMNSFYARWRSKNNYYAYDYNSGQYSLVNGMGERTQVGFNEVNNNYIIPNSVDITEGFMGLVNNGSTDITITIGKYGVSVADTKALNNAYENYNSTLSALNDLLNEFNSLGHGYGMMFEGGDPPGGGDPFIDVELNIKFGLSFSEKLKIFGIGEVFTANAISFDYMTFKWNSNMRRFKYIPYKTATSSLRLGVYGLYGGIKQDWGLMRFSPSGQLGLTYVERGSPTRFNIIDVGYMFGFGIDFKVTLSSEKYINSYIQYQSEWNDKVGGSIYPFLH